MTIIQQEDRKWLQKYSKVKQSQIIETIALYNFHHLFEKDKAKPQNHIYNNTEYMFFNLI